MRKLAILALLLLVAACRDNHDREPSTSPTVGSSPTRALKPAVMLRHEVFATAVRDAVVRGDLGSAQRNAVELGAVTVDGTPEIVERAKATKEASDAVVHATTLDAAAHATGALIRTCADCHARMTGPTRLEVEPAPSAEPGRRPRMRRHIWAMNQLWDGLIGNSEVPWRAGAEALGDPALAPSELVPANSRTPEVDRLAASVQSLGARAVAASDTGVRANLYGDLLTTCADCHARTR